MTSKAQQLINRFPFTDLAIAVSRRGARREAFLKSFVDGYNPHSYAVFRQCLPMIYGVQTPLLTAPKEKWSDIEGVIEKKSKAIDKEANLEVARLLRDLIAGRRFDAYHIDEQPLRLGHNQIAPIGLKFCCVENESLIFQFPQPRASHDLTEEIAISMMSMIHHAYVFGDYASANIELADLSAIERGGCREPRFRRLNREDLLGRDELGAHVQSVYEILWELAGKK